MREMTITIYDAEELKERHPKAFEKAKNKFFSNSELFWMDETIDSLKGLIHALNLKIQDYQIGAYSRGNTLKIYPNGDEDVSAYTDSKAIKYFESCVNTEKACPFTGYCADDDLIDEFKEAINNGRSIKEAIEIDCLSRVVKILEGEYDYQSSDEGFIEYCLCNNIEFDKRGNIVEN